MPATISIEPSALSGPVAEEVRGLIAAAAVADGVQPVSEDVLLHLADSTAAAAAVGRGGGLVKTGEGLDREPPGAAARHLLARDGSGRLVGYVHLAAPSTELPTGTSEPPAARAAVAAELVVHPEERRHGVGGALLTAAERETAGDELRVWSHGRLVPAAALARSRGYAESRVLWQLHRSLGSAPPEASFPAGVHLRAFLPGQDDDAWLALNARAFADHPEQGSWSRADLQLRMAESWFDPAGFLLAERGSRLVGFHWTKVHPRGAGPAGDLPMGEVYVLGVDPDCQGEGLGPALTLAGLAYLRSRGLTEVMLYADDSNRAALRIYERLGFRKWRVDVQFSRSGG